MAIFGYTLVPAHEVNGGGLPGPSTAAATEGAKRLFLGRGRTRWAIIGMISFCFLLLFGAWGNSEQDDFEATGLLSAAQKVGQYTGRLNPASWHNKGVLYGDIGLPAYSSGGRRPQGEDLWVKGSGRKHISYTTPFNPDDLTLAEDECDAFFPGLYKDIDRSVEYFTTKQEYNKEYLEYSCDDGIWTHARVVIYNNRLYLKYYQQSDFTRSQAALALLHMAVVTSREKLPNVEFCIGMMDWGSRGKFGLDRAPDLEDVWLMPDYGWFSWPEHVGSYQELRANTERVEKEIGWEGKVSKLFWRGSMKVGTADRESMFQMADGHDWNDVKAIDWGAPDRQPVPMEDHCRWKFHGFPEGNTYSGRLRYLQNCRVVIVTHEPRWLQHWTHLYNADWNSPDQNIVFVPPPEGEKEGVIVHDGDGREFRDRTWERLPEVMDRLLENDTLARKIADNQWNFFRERYITPASAMCYWRKALWGFSKVQKYTVDLSGSETSYESFVLKGMKGADPFNH